jgi:hypothetical protein
MHFSASICLALAVLGLAACEPAYEDGHLSRNINRQRVARDACLSTQAAALDDHSSPPEAIGQSAAAACSVQNDRLIQLMSTMDSSSQEHIIVAVRKNSILKATTYVLNARTAAGQ